MQKIKKQQLIAVVVLVVTLFIGAIIYSPENNIFTSIYLRVILGLLLGYVLIRGFYGFAGGINRAMRGHSLALLRSLMYMFIITTFLVGILLIVSGGTDSYNLWINPINLGLIIGAILFGFGMSFASCCATGSLTDGVDQPLKLLIVIFGFGLGVFLGFPIQKYSPIVTEGYQISFLSISDNIIISVIFGILITILLSSLVIFITKKIESKWRAQGKKNLISSENISHNKEYDTPFERPFSLIQSAILISIIFFVMTALTKSGWGASTPFGLWFGKLLMLMGLSAQSLGQFTGKGAEFFQTPLIYDPVTVQNISILIGGIVAALSMNKFKPTFKIRFKYAMFFLFGGLIMGLGTRFAMGCNVGALYTPIANFSLSGWIFLVFMIVGAIGGNLIYKKVQ